MPNVDIINAAIEAHSAWIKRFSDAFANSANPVEFDVSKLARVDACDFGLWLGTESAQEALGARLFMEVVVLHEKFHRHAALVARELKGNVGLQQSNSPHFETLRTYSQALIAKLESVKNSNS